MNGVVKPHRILIVCTINSFIRGGETSEAVDIATSSIIIT